MSRYAEVAVDAPVAHSRTFSYSIPERLHPEPGQLVWAPFGRRILQGVVMELVESAQVEATRDILQTVEPGRLLDDTALALARWLSRYYLCPLFDALALFLPPGFKNRVRSQISPGDLSDAELEELKPATREALAALAESRRMAERDFSRQLGRAGSRELNRLVDRGLVRRSVSLPRPRSFRYLAQLLPAGAPDASGAWPGSNVAVSERQGKLLQAVREQAAGYSMTLANREFGNGVGDALVEKGLLAMEWIRQETRTVGDYEDFPMGKAGLQRPGPELEPEPEPGPDLDSEPGSEPGSEPLAGADGLPDAEGQAYLQPEPPLTLTPAQAAALAPVVEALENPALRPRTFLLHGVTGSGKTEVYLQAIARAAAKGQQAIFLVPEISLTPQTVQRVHARFPGRVAVTHSGLSDRQKFDQWWRIRDGEYDVVVGPRSALFSPLPDLGLIVVDEEHEWTYKQVEGQPLYHARTAAMELSRLTGAPVVLGSATPDVESYYHARQGRLRLLELPHRIGFGANAGPVSQVSQVGPVNPGHGNVANSGPGEADALPAGIGLPQVAIADMRQELREGNRSIFSAALGQGLEECLAAGKQAILFLNQRGSAPMVQCRDCGYVVVCSSCASTLTYHGAESRLRCHQCNRRSRMPSTCRRCQGRSIRHLGIGTQRVVDEVKARFPDAMVERWDSDATRSGLDPEEAMRRLARGEIQVLVGTQMVAKGLDLPNVTLVGVVLADIGIYRPDFRAGEKAFGLLCQVAGRAGRGLEPGMVIIQTYNPDNYAIAAAARQDYSSLFETEILTRRLQGNPPFNRLVRLLFQDVNQTACQRQAMAAARAMQENIRAQGLTDIRVIGPAPGIPHRVRGRYRWSLLLRGRNLHRFLDGIDLPARGLTIDVDPVELL